jgi:hypothetical protein
VMITHFPVKSSGESITASVVGSDVGSPPGG